MTIYGSNIKPNVSYAKKIANNFKRQKEIMDVYDFWYGDYRNSELIEKYLLNYDLFNGRLDVSLYDDPVCFNIGSTEVKFSYNSITHYPLISQVAKALHGEMISRPFKPMAKDLGTTSQTLRTKKWNEMIREFIMSDIINPIKDELTHMFLQQQGVTDALQLPPEVVQQMEAQINQQIQARTPAEILEFVENDYKSPTLRQAQRLVDYFVQHLDIKYKQEEGFKHAIITGVEAYYVGERAGEPVFELCNPLYLSWGGSKDTEWIQEATWVKYERWITLEEATQKYAEYLDKKDYKTLGSFLEIIPNRAKSDDYKRDLVQNRVMYELSLEDSPILKKYGDADYRTKKGQNTIKKIYEEVMAKYGSEGWSFSSFGVREAHICWIDKCKMYKVTREVNGQEKTFYEDEHYTPQPSDIEVVEIWVNEAWEGTKLGSTGVDDIMINIRPIPYQHKSVYSPYGVQLPYVGKAYDVHMNNAKNVSIVDLGKPWQKEYDTLMAQIKHDMATDMGRLFIMMLDWKPDEIDYPEWFDIMRNGSLITLTSKKMGMGAIDPNLLRSIDVSKSQNIAEKYNLLQGIRQNLVMAMNFNDYRIGSIGQYATNQNIQQAQVASYNQTEGFFETHRKIVERALNVFMNKAKAIYRDNEKLHFILDDAARIELELTPEFWYEELGIEFTTSTDELKRVESLRNNMLTFAQNGMSLEGVLALSLADTPSDIIDIMKREQRRMDEQRAQEMQAQQEQLQAKLQAEAKDKDEDRKMKYQMHKETLESQEKRTLDDREKFRLQADANRNNQADMLEKAEMDNKIKELIESRKIELEKAKSRDERLLKMEELKLYDRELSLKEKEMKDQSRLKEKEIAIKKVQAKRPSVKK